MFNSLFQKNQRFDTSSEDELRIERYRRLWLYYASPNGNPYGGVEGAPSLSGLNGLPEYITSIFNYVPFIINADLHLLLGSFSLKSVRSTLNARATEKIRDFCRALDIERCLYATFLSALVCGDSYVKVIPDDRNGARFITLDSASVHPRLEPHDHQSVKEMLISYRFRDEENRLRNYAELWTDKRVDVRIDGKPVSGSSGEHPFGTIPVLHFACSPLPGSYFGRPSYVDILADLDRLNSASGAVFETFKYYGSPKLVLKGIMAPELELDPDIRQFWQIPSGDADLSFLEWKNASGLVNDILKLDSVVRRKMPEFVLQTVSGSTFPTSGYAISLKLSLLHAKISTYATAFKRAAERMLNMALRIAGKRTGSARIELGPAFPARRRELIELYSRLQAEGWVTPEEAQRELGLDGELL